MEAVNQNYLKSVLELEKTLLYLKDHWVTQEILVENYMWFSISMDWAYSPEIQKLTPMKKLDDRLIYDISHYFPLNLTQTHMGQLQYRISCLDALYHFIVNCNPDLEKEQIGNLLIASLEQKCNERTR